MKRQLSCIYCSIEYSKEQSPGTVNPLNDFFYAQIEDDGAYNVECPNGHKNFIIDQNLKFQLLFESGLYAYVRGFYRESVTSVWAGLERFYEFASRVILHSFEVLPGQIEEIISETDGASEKQIGGFYYLYSARFKKPLAYLHKDKDFKFRNRVIHKGHFPSEEKTISFIKRIYFHITSILQELNENHHKYVVFADGFENSGKSNKRTTQETRGMVTVMKMPVCINISSMVNTTNKLLVNDLDHYLGELRKGLSPS